MANREIRNSNVRKIIHRYISKVYSALELICVNDNFLSLYSKNYCKQCWNEKKALKNQTCLTHKKIT